MELQFLLRPLVVNLTLRLKLRLVLHLQSRLLHRTHPLRLQRIKTTNLVLVNHRLQIVTNQTRSLGSQNQLHYVSRITSSRPVLTPTRSQEQQQHVTEVLIVIGNLVQY